jgi:hypothetical protein
MNLLSKSIFFFLTVCVMAFQSNCDAYTLDWSRQIGTPGNETTWYEVGHAVSADGLGNVYVSGETDGNLGGINAGGTDVFLAKYNFAGTLAWTKQLGTSGYEDAHGVAADSLGNNFISGWTQGSLGGPNAGSTDAFVSRYDVNGNLQWTRQVGTAADDRSFGLAADGAGNVYSVGWTYGSLAGPLTGTINAFLYKYNSAGSLLWAKQSNFSPFSSGYAVTSDTLGNVFITGTTVFDTFVSKYDSAGNFQWNQVFGSAQFDEGAALAADGLGNVYVVGETRGNLAGPNLGFSDAYLSKFNAAGALLWTKQFGTAGDDNARGVTIDNAGNICIAGATTGSLYGPNLGQTDLFLAKFDSSGNLLDSAQLGTAGDESNHSISFDSSSGALYVAGTTTGSFGGPSAGNSDVYLLKFAVPEPSTMILFAGSLFLFFMMKNAGLYS